jgi:hypothetical protein
MTSMDDHQDMEIQSKNLNRFIAKLYRIINSDDPTVRWVPGGQKFLILDPKKFSQTVLPKYFKHSKFTSFVRQLNFYGFHKKRIITSDLVTDDNNTAALADLGDAVCFQHEFFQQNQPKLLLRIQRTTKQSSATAAAESLSLNKQKELEDLQEQMREMKKQIETSRDEFDIKIAAARAEIELDYLHRIQAIEVCYRDLVTMLLRNKQQSSGFPLPKPGAVPRPGVARSISNSSRDAPAHTRNVMLGQTVVPRDYLVGKKLDMLSQLHNTASRKTLYDDLAAKASSVNVDALVGAATKHLLPSSKGKDDNAAKLAHDMQMRASLNEILRRNKQLLAQYSTGNAAA